jgi:hypothetical protein
LISAGRPVGAAAKGRAVLDAKAASARRAPLPQVLALRTEGLSLRCIAAALNAYGVAAPRGRGWHAATVAELLRQATEAPPMLPDGAGSKHVRRAPSRSTRGPSRLRPSYAIEQAIGRARVGHLEPLL